jgi:hypothetical protein
MFLRLPSKHLILHITLPPAKRNLSGLINCDPGICRVLSSFYYLNLSQIFQACGLSYALTNYAQKCAL